MQSRAMQSTFERLTIAKLCFASMLLGASLLLTACERPTHDSVSETRKVENFQAVDVRGAGELTIAVGEPASLQLHGSAKTLETIETRVSGDTLVIDIARNRWRWFGDQGRLKINISAPELKSLRSSGAGDIRITGLNGGDHEIHVAGAHDVKADGKVDKLTVLLDGAGNIDYRKVIAADAEVTLNGAGDAEVQVTHLLRATVNGVGAIHYEGQPEKVESEIHGVGSIGRR